MSALKVYACVQWDAATETCGAHAYVDPPTLLPPLTVDEGASLGVKLLMLFVAVRAVVMIREAARDRIG